MECRKQKREAQGKSTELPSDLIKEIISRVPVKDLIRFRCVSKSWSSFIYTDPSLSRLQFDRTASKDRPYFIVTKDSGNYWFGLDSIDDENAIIEEIHNPWINEDDGRKAHVVGSCHGLLVLQQRHSHSIAVLNPTTKKHHLVPPNPAGDDNVDVIGFGYDQVHACYKLVTRVKLTSSDDHAAELMIYNVDKGTWRKAKFDDLDDDDGALYGCSNDLEGIYIDGALYWCNDLEDTENMKIIRFVLAAEEFEEVEPPKLGEIMYSPNMSVFDGRLCLACEYEYHTVEFWLMEMECDEGQYYPRRWTKFLSIRDPESLLSSRFSFPDLSPICFSSCGNSILFNVDGIQLFWYDLGKNAYIEHKYPSYSRVRVTCCERSLIGIGIF